MWCSELNPVSVQQNTAFKQIKDPLKLYFITEFHIRSHLKLLLCSVTAKSVVKRQSLQRKKAFMFFPCTFNRYIPSVLSGLHKHDKGKKMYKHNTHPFFFFCCFFWQSRNKSDKNHYWWFDRLFFFLSLSIVPLIGSDCPSQSRDAIMVAMETSSASAGQPLHNVAAMFLRGRHSNAGWTDRRNAVIAGGPGFKFDWTFF